MAVRWKNKVGFCEFATLLFRGFGLATWMLVVLVLGFGELPFQDLGHCAGRLEASQLESCSCFEVGIIIFLLAHANYFIL